mgnify:FL=1
MKITKDLFVWKTISHELAAHFYYREDSPEVYVLHDDDSETLIDSEEILLDAYYDKSVLGIEVGQLDFHDLAEKENIIPVFWIKNDIIEVCEDNDYTLSSEEIDKVVYDLERYHDAEVGINWEVIKCYIQMIIDEREESNSN